MFTFLPSSRLEWQKVFLFPFRVYLVTAIFVYVGFEQNWPHRWKSDSFDTFALQIALGYVLCFVVFLVTSFVQFFSEEQRSLASRSLGLALISFLLAAFCSPNYVRT